MFSTGHVGMGGSEQRSRLLAEGLAARGWDVRVVGRATMAGRLQVQRRRGLVVVEVPGFQLHPLGGPLYLATAGFLGALWGRRATFVAVQLGSQAIAAWGCAALWSRPWLALSTSNGADGEVLLAVGSSWRGIHRWVLRRASALVGQSPQARAELLRLTSASRTVVIPNPVEVPSVAPPLLGRPHAMYVGRLADGKGVDVLVAAWRMVAAERPEARLTLVGAGGGARPVEAVLRAEVARSATLRGSVAFTGWVADATSLLDTADVFVLPSFAEGVSNALLEACAHGRVVVASAIPGNVTVLGADYPLLFEAGDVAGLAAAIGRAFDDRAVRAAARSRARDCVARFEIGHVLDQYERLLMGVDASGAAAGQSLGDRPASTRS